MKKQILFFTLILTCQFLTGQDINQDSIIESWYSSEYKNTDSLTIALLEMESSQITDIIKTMNQNVIYLSGMVTYYKKDIALLSDRQKTILKELKKLKSK